MKISQLKNKRIIILGFGREGLDTYSFLREQFPNKELFIADKRDFLDFDLKIQKILKRDKNLTLFLGNDYLSSLGGEGVVIKTPGIVLSSIQKFINKKSLITSQTELFFDNCPAKIIGITGTKGKSTTSSLIYSLLKNDKVNAFLLGNIEKPSLSYLTKIKKTDWVVYELSCHQLQGLKKSPHISVFLNLYPEHLDYYKNMKEYFSAKANIFLFQKPSDYLIFSSEIKEISKIGSDILSKKRLIDFKNYASFFENNKSLVTSITHVNNIVVVLEVAKILKISEKVILKTLNNFRKLPHRLEYVGTFDGIGFYDDSIATIPEAVMFALDTLGEDVKTLIVGGLNRGIKFDNLAKRVVASSVKNIILFPDSGTEVKNEILKLDPKSTICFFETEDMEKAISFAFKRTEKGGICLLSPASPSFNLFKDYKERGEVYKKFILLGNGKKD